MIISAIKEHWGDICSAIGLIVSVMGFWFTIHGVRRARSAAEQANSAALSAKRSIMAANALVEFASAMAIMEEIRRLHRESAWKILPDRYSVLKRALLSLRAEHPNLTAQQETTIQASIVNVRGLEQLVERALAANSEPAKVAKMNGILALEIEKISNVLISLKEEIKG